jgi:hypothetical protein
MGLILRHSPPGEPSQTSRGVWGRIKAALKSVPVLRQCLRVAAIIPREIFHSVGGYRFLRTQDLLVVSDGGQTKRAIRRGLGATIRVLQMGCSCTHRASTLRGCMRRCRQGSVPPDRRRLPLALAGYGRDCNHGDGRRSELPKETSRPTQLVSFILIS